MARGALALRLMSWLLVLAACDHNRKDIDLAKHSLYDTGFAEIYSAALEATKALYPNLDDRPGPGKISTAWHEVGMAADTEEVSNQHTMSSSGGAGTSSAQGTSGSPSMGGGGGPTTMQSRRFYIRFDITVIGGRPWRVKIVGHASSWDAGAAMPTELRGMAKPGWLEPRTDALRLAIYNRLRRYAVPMKETHAKVEDSLPKPDPSAFRGVPAGAAKLLADLRVLLLRRNYDALRAALAAGVIWSDGAPGGANEAIAVWEADPSALDAMRDVLAGCTADGAMRVRCSLADHPDTNRYQLVVELQGGRWLVTSFLVRDQ